MSGKPGRQAQPEQVTLGPLTTRRGFLGAGGLALAAVGLAACGSSGGGGRQQTTTAGGAKVAAGPPGPGPFSGGTYGGVVTVGWLDEANSYDPAVGYNDQAWDAICCLLNTPLYMFATANGDPQPALAAALPEVSDDHLHYVIKLRDDVSFSNGQPITAADYVYAWTRVLDPKVASWASAYLYPVVGAQEFVKGKSKTVAGLKAVDDKTVEIRLSTPTYTFINYLAQPFMAAVPKEAVERLGKGFNTQPVSTGPFMVESYSSSDQRSQFKRNPHYAWKGLPYLDGVTYTWGLNENLQLLQLERGTIDIIGGGIGADVLPQVEAQPSLKQYLVRETLSSMQWIALNLASSPFSDVRVRRALNWATNRTALAEVTHGLYEPSGWALPSNLADFHHTGTPYGYDPAKARSLLAAAGVSHLSFTCLSDGNDPWPNVLQLLQQQWKPFGIEMQIHTVSESAYDTETSTMPLRIDSFQDDYDMIQPSALDMIIPNYTVGGAYNVMSYKNPAVDALVTKAQAQATLSASNTYVERIEEQLLADAPAVFLFEATAAVGRSPKLHNFQYVGFFGPSYNRLWL